MDQAQMQCRQDAANVAFDDYPQTRAAQARRGQLASARARTSATSGRPTGSSSRWCASSSSTSARWRSRPIVQAKSYGKPLVLMPATMMGALPAGHFAVQRRARPLTPADLAGKRVGVRSYSQTTGVWVRGILQNDYGVDVDQHPLGDARRTAMWRNIASRRASSGVGPEKNLLQDAARRRARRGDLWRRPAQRPGAQERHPDPDAAARRNGTRKHKVVPINHMVVMTEALSKSNPDAVAGGLPPAARKQARGRPAEARRHRLPAVRGRGLPAGARADDQVMRAAEAHPAHIRRSRSCSTKPPARLRLESEHPVREMGQARLEHQPGMISAGLVGVSQNLSESAKVAEQRRCVEALQSGNTSQALLMAAMTLPGSQRLSSMSLMR